MIEAGAPSPTSGRLSRTTRVLLAAYIVLVPIGWSPLPLNSKWCDVVLVALAVALFARSWRGWRPNALDWLVLLYVAGSVVAIRPEYGWAPGLIALAKQLAVVLVYCVFTAVAREGGAELTLRLLVVTAAALSIAGCAAAAVFAATGSAVRPLGVAMPLPYLGQIFRLYGGTDSPELFACFLTCAIPLAIVPATRLTVRARAFTTAVMTMAGIATFAHSIAGGVLAAAVAYRPALDRHRQRAVRSLLVAAAASALVVVNVALVMTFRDVSFSAGRRTDVPPPREPYVFQDAQGARIANFQVTYNWMSYYLLKRVAVNGFLDAPWRGAGLGRFHDLTERAYRAGLIDAPFRAIDPHSALLGRLAETGVSGGITLAAVWVGAFAAVRRLALRASTRALAIGLLAGFAGLAVNSLNVDVMNFRFLWIGFGLVRGLTGHPGVPGLNDLHTDRAAA